MRYERGGREVYWTSVQQDENLSTHKFLSKDDGNYNADSMSKYQLHVVNELWNMLNQENYELCSGAMAIATLESINEIVKECK